MKFTISKRGRKVPGSLAWKRAAGKIRLPPTVEDDHGLEKLPNALIPTFRRGSVSGGYQLNSKLNLIVAEEFAPVCR